MYCTLYSKLGSLPRVRAVPTGLVFVVARFLFLNGQELCLSNDLE